MSDRLTDAELDRLEELHADARPGSLRFGELGVIVESPGNRAFASLIGATLNALPVLIAELREHRARETAHRAALDTLVDGDGR